MLFLVNDGPLLRKRGALFVGVAHCMIHLELGFFCCCVGLCDLEGFAVFLVGGESGFLSCGTVGLYGGTLASVVRELAVEGSAFVGGAWVDVMGFCVARLAVSVVLSPDAGATRRRAGLLPKVCGIEVTSAAVAEDGV
jgi:hypothetical protein